jgi:hypothetical protein
MANKISKQEIVDIQKIEYKRVRDHLKTGDLVFCSGNYFFSKIIQRLTKSSFSHVGVIYIDDNLGRVLLLESEALIGVRLIPLSKYIEDYKGKKKPYKGNMLIAHVDEKIEQKDLNNGISHGLDELTRPYDNWEIIRIFLRIVFKTGKRERNRNYICSELVHLIFKKAKVYFQFEDSYISPDSIWMDDRVKLKYRLL